ncbi:MAG: deoxyribonuclease V [Candidatus Macondimonas sp.]
MVHPPEIARRPAAWPEELTPAAARDLQEQLRTRVIHEGRLDDVRWIAGVDVAFPAQGAVSRAAAVLLSYPQMVPVAGSVAELPTRFPYVPGLLSFRELPALLAALAGLPEQPDVILVDGQGVAHPRGLGVASHLGVMLDRPTIGVAKSVLCGAYDDPAPERGSQSPLVYKGEVIGTVLRTRERVRPVIVSTGHRVGLPEAVALVQACTRGYRLPEPTRLADRLAGAAPGVPVLGATVPVQYRSDVTTSDLSVQIF